MKAVAHCLPPRIKRAVRELLGTGSHTNRQVDLKRPEYIADNVSAHDAGTLADCSLYRSVLDKIEKAKVVSDVVISYPHVGGQYNPAPGRYAKRVVRDMLCAGADICVANHPHLPLRRELFAGGKSACYALGNFTFTPEIGWYARNVLADYSIALTISISGARKKIENAEFSVLKNVLGKDGVSRVWPVWKYAKTLENGGNAYELLEMENEAVVNRFAGWSRSIAIESSYPLSND